jgi:hypothetical protein
LTQTIPFVLPIGHKFACVALENAGVDHARHNPIDLGGNLWILFEPPFPLGEAWQGWLGSLQVQHLERSNVVLFAHNPSASPEVLDGENETLKQQVVSLCYAVFLTEVFHYDGGLVLTGANVSGTVDVRQVSPLERLYRPNQVMIAGHNQTSLLAAARVATGMQAVHAGLGHHDRLRKGFHAWLRGMMEYYGEERLHQFIRAVEAVILPPKGESTKKFAHRCQLFAGNSAQAKSLCSERAEEFR